MPKSVIRSIFTLFIASASLFAVSAQTVDRETAPAASKYVISARAGAINYLDGQVAVTRPSGRSSLLLLRDEVEVSDRVTTSEDGKAEILLNPGSYMRVGPKTEFEFVSTALDDLRVRVFKGSAIFEVFATNEFRVRIETPSAAFNIGDSGVYRVDIADNGEAKLEVWEGEARIGDPDATRVKDGRASFIGNGTIKIAKFDRDVRDGFEEWSRGRSKELAKNMDRLRNRDMQNALAGTNRSGMWSLFDSFGLWIYDASYGSYCFLPFGRGWASPYGWSYRHSIWYYNIPTIVHPPAAGDPNIARSRAAAPPFARLEESAGYTGARPQPARTSFPDPTFSRSRPAGPISAPAAPIGTQDGARGKR